MELNQAARDLIGNGANATVVTLNPNGTPHVSVVWVALESTIRGDEILMGHLDEHIKVGNIRRNPHMVLSIVDTDPDHWEGPVRPYLKLTGTAAVEEGGVRQFLTELATHVGNPAVSWPPRDAPAGWRSSAAAAGTRSTSTSSPTGSPSTGCGSAAAAGPPPPTRTCC
ncbi:pyridoxamine 5'-phosphate oxidase family protein [Amycolatopsis sp. NBC_00438]|uniref:pyridoxamine 5'-phosphate oxidase family protein n=1 Tax=Amycolatopsis sp. NBC_00438 TaxID=2903558 RepID=UPI002E1B27B5